MKGLLRTLIILLVIDLIGVGGIWFGYTLIQDKKSEETTLQAQITEEIQEGYKNIALARTLASVKEDRAELQKFLYDPSEEGQIEFVSQIEKLGTTTTGAIVETQSLVLTKDKEPSIRGDFTIRGSWENMYYFLRFIEEFPSRLVINRFSAAYSNSDKLWSGGTQIDLRGLKENK